MATALNCSKLSDSKYKNWIKAGLGVLYTKEGIEPFVYDEIEQFQQKCLSDICNNNGLPSGTVCSSCFTENVIVCPTNRICNVGRGKCKFHRDSAKRYLPSGCPNKICHNFKNEIQKAHRYYGPSYKNTDAKQWCSSPWEVAKCFMSPDGYADKTSAAETDFSGIMSVIINYRAFQSKVKDDLYKKENIFLQGIQVDKAVQHSPLLEIEDTLLQQYFIVLQNLLSDPVYLSANTAAQDAKTKLLQLQNDTLVIGKDDIRNVLDDVAKGVQDRLSTKITESEKKKIELIDITRKYVANIDGKGKVSIAELDRALKSAIEEFEKETKESVKKVQLRAKIAKKQKKVCADKEVERLEVEAISGMKQIEEGIRKLKVEAEDEVKRKDITIDNRDYNLEFKAEAGVKQIKESVDKGVNKMGVKAEGGVRQIEESVDNGVNMFKVKTKAGIKQIEESTDKWVFKLHNEAEAGLKKISAKLDETLKKIKRPSREDRYKMLKEELKDEYVAFYHSRYSKIRNSYVLPEMHFVEKQRIRPFEGEIRTPVNSLSEVFQSENSREIFLTADAGFGKTAFCKHLAVSWCQAHRSDKKYEKYFSEDEINTMHDFEFLFLLLLKDSADNCSIDDLILNQISQNLSSKVTIEALQDILHREKCLVILDGLDDWTHPEKLCKKTPKMMPHRNAREKTTILSTSRPWKFGILNLRTSEVNKKLELVKLRSESAQIFEEMAISKIKNIDIAEAKSLAKELHSEIKKNKLEELESVPRLAMHLICLWCDDIPLGQSKCRLYSSITELLLKRTIRKHPEMEQMCEPSRNGIPKCFIENEYCTKYGMYLKALGQLAFETLLSETRETDFAIAKSVADKFLSRDDQKLSLCSGLLTQRTERSLLREVTKVWFTHKTVQEFFCALYICCQNESEVKRIILNKCKSLQNILDMSTVFVFISGMNAEIMSSVSHELMSVINQDKITSKYRSTTDEYCDPLKDIQTMFISCMKETTRDDRSHLYCQDIFFDIDCKDEESFSVLARLTENNKGNMQSINIDTDDGRSLRTIIDLCGLHEYLNINKVVYIGHGEKGQLPVLLNKSPKCLVVSDLGIGSWSREMWETLQNNSLLQAINISNFKMSHDLLKSFLEYLVNTKTLAEIELWHLSCTEHRHSCGYNLDFSMHSALRKLDLREIPDVSRLEVSSQVKRVQLSDITIGEMTLPREMVNLERVVLQFVNMSASTIRDLVKVVEKLSHKVKVKINMCVIEPRTEFERVKQYVLASRNLVVTDDEERMFAFAFETNVESKSTSSIGE